MTIARRALIALVALAGLALAVSGAWLAVVVGPSGTARFSASATGPLMVGPEVLARIDGPVTVRATAAAGPVFIGAAPPQDVLDVVGASRVQRAVSAQFPARTLALRATGSGNLADPRALEVWRSTGTGSLDLDAADAPESVLVVPTTNAPVRVTVELHHGAWFVEAVIALIVGLLVAAAAVVWLAQELGYPLSIGPFTSRGPLADLGSLARRARRGAPHPSSVTALPQGYDQGFDHVPDEDADKDDAAEVVDPSAAAPSTESVVPTEPGREVRP